MHMAVDQAGHQRAPTAVDHAGLCKLDRLGRDLLDAVAFDDQLVAAKQFPGVGIEHLDILEMLDINAVKFGAWKKPNPHPQIAMRQTMSATCGLAGSVANSAIPMPSNARPRLPRMPAG